MNIQSDTEHGFRMHVCVPGSDTVQRRNIAVWGTVTTLQAILTTDLFHKRRYA